MEAVRAAWCMSMPLKTNTLHRCGSGELPVVQNTAGTQVQIVRRFDFDHGKQTMSVITRDKEGAAL